jgi:protoheme IX farnesyltransferase
MLPVVAGERATRRQIMAYSIVLLLTSLTPWWLGGTGAIYGVAALVLSAVFVALAVPVAIRTAQAEDAMRPEKRLFGFSVLYLFALFTALVADRMLLA